MKRLKPVVLAVLVGCACAFFLFREVEDSTSIKSKGNAVAIQIGVFKSADNAEAMRETYGGMVFEDGDVYRVYYSILNKDDNIDFMINYLTDKGINYYLKSISLDEEVLDSGLEYETLMSKTKDEAKISINEQILKFYKEVV